jgi:GDPmannose 4,6-dehydratase
MKAIITGITGMDGSHLADFLLEKGYKVVGVKRRSSQPNEDNIKNALLNKNFELEEGDITDVSSIIKVLKKHKDVDEIYNLAAQSHVGTSFKSPGLTWDVTAKGCMNILEAMVDLELTHVKFYQASSSEMFGSSFSALVNGDYSTDVKDFDVLTDRGRKIFEEVKTIYQDENTKFLPQSPYAIAKCAAHETVRLYRNAYNIHASCGILFNHDSERRGELFVTRKITKWMTEFFSFMKNNSLTLNNIMDTSGDKIIFSKRLDKRYVIDVDNMGEEALLNPLYFSKIRLGDIDTYRDLGYAGDYVKAMWLMLQQNTPDDYVICTGNTIKIRDFLKLSLDSCKDYLKIEGDIDINDLFVQDPKFMRPAEVPFLRGDYSKAHEKLSWSPKVFINSLVDIMVKNDFERLGF